MNAHIRPAQPVDGPALAQIYAPFCRDTNVSFELTAPTEDEMASRIASIGSAFPWLVLIDDGHVAGYTYASRHRERLAYQWAVDVSAYVNENYRRRGVGRALYTALFALLVAAGYYKAFAGIALPNPASIGLHTAFGFKPVGVYRGVGYKLGAWHDVAWFQRDLRPEMPQPATPLPISAVGWAEWEQAAQIGMLYYRG